MFKMLCGTEFGVKVVSDEGFEVALISRGCDGLAVTYREGEKWLYMDADDDLPCPLPDKSALSVKLLSNPGLFIYVPACLKWLEPKEKPMEEFEALRILENIQRALEFQDKSFAKRLKFIGSPLAILFYRR